VGDPEIPDLSEALSDDPFLERLVQIDAPMDVKTGSTLNARVTLPGEAETVLGDPVGERTAVRGRHNWVPIGPRNVGGRVRAIAIDHEHPEVMYAAPASGGVFKTRDAGESWFPLWHDEPSLSLAALAICRGNTQVIWAATGEAMQGRSGDAPLLIAGVLRSPDGGATWTQPADDQPIRNVRLHAVAAHPTNENIAWAVGPLGVYRTIDGGRRWTTFAERRPFSDVAFAEFAQGLRLFLVMSGFVEVAGPPGPATSRRGLVVRLDAPDDPNNAHIAAILPNAPGPGVAEHVPHPLLAHGTPTPPPAAGAPDPANGKIAIHEDTAHARADPVVYVVFANARRHALGIFRCQDAQTAPANAMTFTPLVPAASFAGEEQGDYNLSLAVSPDDPNHLAFGMQKLYLNRLANSAAPSADHWLLAQMEDLYHIDRAHHADHHALVFARVGAAPNPFQGPFAAGTMLLWDANDGGISVSGDWESGESYVGPPVPTRVPPASLPVREGAITWRKRSHGIGATQMYDVTQHPRLPTVLGCGFQDNGAWVGTGGPSWQFVLSADGGFVAFDPDDPYRILATWQEGIAECRFPGLLRDALPLLGDSVREGFWPRMLDDGFLGCDRPVFVAETAFHPSQPGRVLTARRNRLYGTQVTTGDRWEPELLGHGIEILHEPTSAGAASSSLEVHDTPGGRALGFPAQLNTTEAREDRRLISRVRSLVGQPFAIPNGQILRLSFSNDTATGAARRIDVPLTVGGDLPASATAPQLAAYLARRIRSELARGPAADRPAVRVLPLVWPATTRVILASADTGANRRISVEGNAAGPLNVVAREYRGADAGAGGEALPAMVEFRFTSSVVGRPGRAVDLSTKTLGLRREGAAPLVSIDFDHDVPDPTCVRASDLANAFRAKLPAARYQVLDGIAAWGIRLSATAPAPAPADPPPVVTLSGDLAADLGVDDGLDPGATGRTVRINRRTEFDKAGTFDLSGAGTPPPARHLQVAEGPPGGPPNHQTVLQPLGPGFIGPSDLTAVTSVELCDAIRRMIGDARTFGVRCDLDVYPDHRLNKMFDASMEGMVTEVAFGPTGSRRVWAGDVQGRLYRSVDDGRSWAGVPSFPPSGRYGAVEAIAVSPDAPDTVLAGVFIEGAYSTSVAFLFRTTDGGHHWADAGDGIEFVVNNIHHRVGVSSVVIDPAAPDHVFAGTEFGVFRSTDGGMTFTPVCEGLPNTPVVDLALEPTTRMLRAGLWGRGVYELHVGERKPKNERLHIRSTVLDDGTAQPYPGPDLLAHAPAPLRLDTSPDIKQTRRDPRRGLRPDGVEFDTALLDGVEFDDELRHEDVREGRAFVCVQVHNRGAFSTSTVRVAALWAPADEGPPPLGRGLADVLDAGPLTRSARFGAWTVIADDLLPDPHGIGHDIVAPGYPRIAVLGVAPAFQWQSGDLLGHRRIGLLALCRSDEDDLKLRTTDVLDLVRTEAKAAYRECDVVPAAEDSRIVLRATGTAGFQIQGPADATGRNLANGGPPLGLNTAAAGTLELALTESEPYDLSGAVGRFRVTIDHDVTIEFGGDEPAVDRRHATADEVAAILNRGFVANGVPVRARGVGRGVLLVLERLGQATFEASGTAATRFGIVAAQGSTSAVNSPPGLMDITPPLALRLVVRTPVEVALGTRTAGLPYPAHATAAEVRAAINRQLDIGSAFGVRAERRSLRLSVRRSATEAAATKVVSGSYALADIVGSPDEIPSADERLTRLRALAAHDRDALTAGQRNFLYVRVANIGTVRGNPARVRVFEVGAASPFAVTGQQISSATEELGVGQSAVVEVPFELDDRPSGARVLVLAVADTETEALDPPQHFDSLDGAHRFCLDSTAAAMRELVVS
jgi:photosystem II stability/assembly factor-like uncharacterized protein